MISSSRFVAKGYIVNINVLVLRAHTKIIVANTWILGEERESL